MADDKKNIPDAERGGNCIGVFEVPDPRKIPEQNILLATRKGVALSYVPTQIAI